MLAYANCERKHARLFTPTSFENDQCAKKLAEKSVDMSVSGARIDEFAVALS